MKETGLNFLSFLVLSISESANKQRNGLNGEADIYGSMKRNILSKHKFGTEKKKTKKPDLIIK